MTDPASVVTGYPVRVKLELEFADGVIVSREAAFTSMAALVHPTINSEAAASDLWYQVTKMLKILLRQRVFALVGDPEAKAPNGAPLWRMAAALYEDGLSHDWSSP